MHKPCILARPSFVYIKFGKGGAESFHQILDILHSILFARKILSFFSLRYFDIFQFRTFYDTSCRIKINLICKINRWNRIRVFIIYRTISLLYEAI